MFQITGCDLRQGTLLSAGCVNEAAIIKALRKRVTGRPPPYPGAIPGLSIAIATTNPLPVRCVYINVSLFWVQGKEPSAANFWVFWSMQKFYVKIGIENVRFCPAVLVINLLLGGVSPADMIDDRKRSKAFFSLVLA